MRYRLSLFRCLTPTSLLTSALLTTQPAFADQDVTLRFAAEVQGQPFVCGQHYEGVGTSTTRITPSDFRLYVSAVNLLDADGNAVPLTLDQDGVWQYENVALLDFEDGSGPCQNGNTALNTTIRGTLPDGDYRGVQFTLGLPFALNHADNLLAPSPLNLSAMFWNWQGGYRFFKVDIASVGDAAPQGGMAGGMGAGMNGGMRSGMGGGMQGAGGHGNAAFLIHLGSTGCASASTTTSPANACQNPNTVPVQLANYDFANGSIVVDLAALLQFSDLTSNTAGTPPGCMSGVDDPECAGLFRAFGLDGSGQKLFHAR